jgi:hypothetical protein
MTGSSLKPTPTWTRCPLRADVKELLDELACPADEARVEGAA